VVTSLSGEDVLGGSVTRRGYDFWAETINQQGGVEVGGQRFKVQMAYADDQSKPATGADAAERMISQEKVDLILGPYTSGVTLAVAPICEKYRVPMLAGSAESPNVWKAKPKYTYGIIPSVDLTAGKSLGVLAQQAEPGPTSAAIIGVNEPFSKEAAEGFLKGAQDLKLNVVRQEFIPSSADLTPLVSSVAAARPDIVAVGGHEEVLINFVKAARSLNFAPKAIIMHYGVTVPDFAKNLGRDAEGVFGLAVWTPDVDFRDDLFGSAKQYDEAAYKRWGTRPDYTEAACSASGLVFQAAAAKLGKKPPLSTDDREALSAAIEQVDIGTFYGPIKFATEGEHYHDNTEPVPVLVQIRDGAVVAVGPANAKQADMTYPLPAWDAR
jgi:branched-chain amino acid transport system substrate-binding protein